MKVSELLDSIRKRDLVLPEFQREYVWTSDQAKQLMVSLVKGYPIGGLLLWKTDNPPDLKKINKLPEKLGTLNVILDGQQRLTTLYMLLRNEIPPYYSEADIETDPRGLFYNLENSEFQYYQASRMKANPLWHRVIDCFTNPSINVFSLAQQQTDDQQQAFSLAQKYNGWLNKLRAVETMDLPVQTVPPDASLDEAIDIFDRVNSQGTRLTDAELALTHITSKWSTARREMKEKIEDLSQRNFYFDLSFMTRALTGVVMNRALYETIHIADKSRLQDGWKVLIKVLDYLSNILPHRACIHSTEDLNTTNVLVPLIVYIALNKGKFPNDKTLKNALHWLYAAHIWARYTAQTDQRLEHDVLLVVRETSPWEALRAEIIDQRGRIEVKASDFEGRGTPHPLFRAVYVLAKINGAVDWFNGTKLDSPHGQAYHIHSHHIFPQSLLYKSEYDADNHLHRKIINEIANRAFLTADTNWEISNTPPAEYLPRVEERYPGALVDQFIPMDPSLWVLNKFEDFLSARREIIQRKLNEFMASLITEPEKTWERPIRDLIQLGESKTLEFKSTLQWDVVQNQQNTNLRLSVIKTVAAFLNSDGGTLIIGVDDTGTPYGLENDLKLLSGSLDRFSQLLSSLFADHIGPQYAHLVKSRFEKLDNVSVCILDVQNAPEPVFVNGSKGKEFFVRVGNTTRALDPQETMQYAEMKWS